MSSYVLYRFLLLAEDILSTLSLSVILKGVQATYS